MILSKQIKPQSVYCLVRVSITLKNGVRGWVEAKTIGFFEKEKDIHTASQLPDMLS